MPYNPYYPYPPQSPYPPGYGFQQPQPQPQQQQQPQQNLYAFVNGIEGAKSFMMQPNQTVLLMDSDQPICYRKQSNGMGQSSIAYFRLVETTEEEIRGARKQEPSADYVTKADFDELARRVDSLAQKDK